MGAGVGGSCTWSGDERTQTSQLRGPRLQEATSHVSSGNTGISVLSVKELEVMPGFTSVRSLKT